MSGDRVELVVPAKGEYAKVVRMTAASIASRMGMSVDDVEDVRMAVEEAFVHAVDGGPRADSIRFAFEVSEERLRITVCVGQDGGVLDEDAERRASLSAFILDSVCDEHEFVTEHDGTRWLRIDKRAKAVDAR